jgi:hypothetical protein
MKNVVASGKRLYQFFLGNGRLSFIITAFGAYSVVEDRRSAVGTVCDSGGLSFVVSPSFFTPG